MPHDIDAMAERDRMKSLLRGVFAELHGQDSEDVAKNSHDFVFHMTDWLSDLVALRSLYLAPDTPADIAARQIVGFLYHVIPHLNEAGRLLLGDVPDPFARPSDPVSRELEAMPDEDLSAIAARCEAASSRPWVSMVEGRDHTSGSSFIRTGPPEQRGDDIELTGATIADQDFIAHARQDVPRLVQELRRLRRLVDER